MRDGLAEGEALGEELGMTDGLVEGEALGDDVTGFPGDEGASGIGAGGTVGGLCECESGVVGTCVGVVFG
mgnify:CR=1 FL=1